MLCWGNAESGQLGIGGEAEGASPAVREPRVCQAFGGGGRGLREVACGGQHSLFLLRDGRVFTCGSNRCGQLGHDEPSSSPGTYAQEVESSPSPPLPPYVSLLLTGVAFYHFRQNVNLSDY